MDDYILDHRGPKNQLADFGFAGASVGGELGHDEVELAERFMEVVVVGVAFADVAERSWTARIMVARRTVSAVFSWP